MYHDSKSTPGSVFQRQLDKEESRDPRVREEQSPNTAPRNSQSNQESSQSNNEPIELIPDRSDPAQGANAESPRLSVAGRREKGERDPKQVVRRFDVDTDVTQRRMTDTGGGQGASPAASPAVASDMTAQELPEPNVTRELSNAASVICDDPIEEGGIESSISMTSLPLGFFTPAEVEEDFIFLEDEDISRNFGSIFDSINPGDFSNWYSNNILKHNRMIPMQFYHKSSQTQPYVPRDPQSQFDTNRNLGGLVNGDLFFDNLRFILGGNYEHLSVTTGQPTTTFAFASRYRDFDPAARNLVDALNRRGIYFIPWSLILQTLGIPVLTIDTFSFDEYRQLFPPMQEQREEEFVQNRSRPPEWYKTNLNIITNINMLRRRNLVASPDNKVTDIYEYLNTLASNTGGSISVDPNVDNYKIIYDHTFRAPAGYLPLDRMRQYPATILNKDLVTVSSHQRITDQFYTNKDLQERYRKSIYRAHLEAYPVADEVRFRGATNPMNPVNYVEIEFEPQSAENVEQRSISPRDPESGFNVEAPRPKRDDIVQKFPHRQVMRMQEINNLIIGAPTEQQLSDPTSAFSGTSQVPFDYWLNQNLKNYNLISFKMNHKSTLASLLSIANLDTAFLEMIDNKTPSNPTYYTQILDSFLNTQEFETERTRNDDLDSVAVNLRPQEIRSPIEMFKNFISNDSRTAFWNTKQIDDFSYPLAYPGISQNQDRADADDSGDRNEYGDIVFDAFNREDLHFRVEGRLSDYLKPEDDFGIEPDREDTFESLYEEVYKNVLSIDRHRSGEEIVCGAKAHSEVIAYKLVKHDGITDEVLQEFYFFNTRQVEDFRFIDSQVLPNKLYTYRIYTINFVVGSKYFYDVNDSKILLKLQDDNRAVRQRLRDFGPDFSPVIQNNESQFDSPLFRPDEDEGRDNPRTISADDMMGISVPLKVWPNFRLIESPYIEASVTSTTNDLPPLYPDVQVMDSHRSSKENKSAVMIYPFARFGFAEEMPITIEPEDGLRLDDMRAKQYFSDRLTPDGFLAPRNPNRGMAEFMTQLQYRTDSPAERYEMFYMFEPPTDYSSFYSKGYKVVTTPEKSFFDLNLPYNVKIYTTFRSIDTAGFSNPSPVFELTRHNYGDGTYTTFEPYEEPIKEPVITCSRLVSIEPSIRQTTFNVDTREGLNSFDTVPEDLNSIILGLEQPDKPLIWNRKFKFRFTSVSSNNSFDVNCKFEYDKLLIESESVTEGPRVSQGSENPFDIFRQATREVNRAFSNVIIESMPQYDDFDAGPGHSQEDTADITIMNAEVGAIDAAVLENLTEDSAFSRRPTSESEGPSEPIVAEFDDTYSAQASGSRDRQTGGGREPNSEDVAEQHRRAQSQNR